MVEGAGGRWGRKLILGFPEGHRSSKVDKWHLERKNGMERESDSQQKGWVCGCGVLPPDLTLLTMLMKLRSWGLVKVSLSLTLTYSTYINIFQIYRSIDLPQCKFKAEIWVKMPLYLECNQDTVTDFSLSHITSTNTILHLETDVVELIVLLINLFIYLSTKAWLHQKVTTQFIYSR